MGNLFILLSGQIDHNNEEIDQAHKEKEALENAHDKIDKILNNDRLSPDQKEQRVDQVLDEMDVDLGDMIDKLEKANIHVSEDIRNLHVKQNETIETHKDLASDLGGRPKDSLGII